MTKCTYGKKSKTLDANPRVLEYDQAGTDDGCYMVTLVKGYAFDDPAARTEDDPDAVMACHSRSFEGVTRAVERIRMAQPCRCGRCVSPNRKIKG